MQLTEKQLKIQEFADKTLSFGCIVLRLLHDDEQWNRVYNLCYLLDFEEVRIAGQKNFCMADLVKKEINNETNDDRITIIWHPMNRGRLCYLRWINDIDVTNSDERKFMMMTFMDNPKYLQQTVLDRPEELLDLVIAFLDTLPKE